jgi:hypothetical protein
MSRLPDFLVQYTNTVEMYLKLSTKCTNWP